jgi:hypothetical protein
MSGPVMLAMASQELARRAIQNTNLRHDEHLLAMASHSRTTPVSAKIMFSKTSPTIFMQLVTNMFYSIN